MRALLDTNLFISYPLSRRRMASAIGAILEAATAGLFTLHFAPEVAEEIERAVAERPDLTARITPAEVRDLTRSLREIAEAVPRLRDVAPKIGRDPGDDYLIAQAVVARADYLVSWDKDLLDLVEVAGVLIVSPRPSSTSYGRPAG